MDVLAGIAAPLAPVVILEVAGVTLLALLAFLILIGMRKTAVTWLGALVSLLEHTTVFGVHIFRWLAHALDRATHFVETELGNAAAHVSRPIADFFTHLAAAIEYAAFTTAYLAEDAYDAFHKLRHAVIPALIHGLTAPVRAIAHGGYVTAHYLARALARFQTAVLRDFRYAERRAMAGYAVALAALAHAFGIAVPGALDWTGLNVGRWWGDTWRTLRRRVTRLEAALGAAVFSGLVLKVLARHLPWYRCANVNRMARQLCRSPFHFVDDLLTLFADFFVLTNICRVIPWLESAFGAVATPLIEQLARAGAGLCNASYAPGESLATPELHLPPVQSGTLHLP